MSAGDRLRAFRKRHGFSQSKAADVCNVSRRTWEGWETRSHEPPSCLWPLLDYIDRFRQIGGHWTEAR